MSVVTYQSGDVSLQFTDGTVHVSVVQCTFYFYFYCTVMVMVRVQVGTSTQYTAVPGFFLVKNDIIPYLLHVFEVICMNVCVATCMYSLCTYSGIMQYVY